MTRFSDFDLLPEAILVHRDGTIVYANRAAWRLLGAGRAEDVLGRPSTSFVHAEDREVVEQRMRNAGEGRINALREIKLARLDGHILEVESLSLPIRLDDGPGVLAYVRDVTERNRTARALRDSENRCRELMESGGDLIVVVDSKGHVVDRSPSIQNVLGYEPESTGTAPVINKIHPDDRANVASIFRRLLSEPETAQHFTTRVRHANGEWRTVEVIGKNLLDRSSIRGIVFNARDITARQQLEEQIAQAQRVESLGRVAATVVHEFNNVLMGIQSLATVIARSSLGDDLLQQRVQLILKSVARGKQINDEILRFARPSQPRMRKFEVKPWLEAVVTEFLAQNTSPMEVTLHVDESLPPLMGDPDQLQQVLFNLFFNARDAMQAGGSLHVEARSRSSDRNGQKQECVVLSVKDTGSGMSKEVAERIFEPLFTTKPKGTGLGLPISYQIVKRHSGQLTVRTAPAHGTTFEILLPASTGQSLRTEARDRRRG